MKKALILTLALTIIGVTFAQTSTKVFESSKLNSKRTLKIHLPKNYDPSSNLKYPLVFVFDADYLFEPVVGQTKFQSYFDEMPGSIIVGVVQGNERVYDSFFDDVTGLPLESGARFFEFVGQELIPYLDSKYKTSDFRVAVGHNIMGNFINSFMLKDKPLFHAYVNLSPDLKGSMGDNIVHRLSNARSEFFYYMATSTDDKRMLHETIMETNGKIKQIENTNVTYYFDEFKDESHYTLVTGAISRAFDKIFELYKPLQEKELKEKVLPYEGTLDKYLVDRYKKIEDRFGIVKPIAEEEFQKVVAVAEEREDLESLEKLGKLANKEYPESMLGDYYLAQHAEKIGKPKKAVKFYEEALLLDATTSITYEDVSLKLQEIKATLEEQDIEDPDLEGEGAEILTEELTEGVAVEGSTED
ncbi:esterase [Mangrovimonas sp. CR14]|uniref:alpha/beta hydrolase n=1 Tax=Mangrovimonas sp. CR14 TaxID=2706120 RepID=UPI00142371FD|nr:alpha/beta hydrolase-fold protein [Mangrovimonas sp. CR14]NIK91082.1 esterase [Mangrovimonas sp. CR14]